MRRMPQSEVERIAQVFQVLAKTKQKTVDKGREKRYNKNAENNQRLCRCRLAVWRQLPKLFPASSTPVTCSKNKEHPSWVLLFLEIKRILTRVEGGAASGNERFALRT